MSFLEEPQEVAEYMVPVGTEFKPGTSATRSVSLLHLQNVCITDMSRYIPDSNSLKLESHLTCPFLTVHSYHVRHAINLTNFIFVALI